MNKRNFLPLLLLSMLCTCVLAQNIERVEPPNWWVGFVNQDLQLLVYGKDISQLTATIDWPGVTLQSTLTTGNPNYLFMNLHVAPDARVGEVPLNFTSPDGKVMVRKYSLQARETPGTAFEGFDQTDVLYLITPDRFVNGDRANDETADTKEGLNRAFPGGRHGGDIAGVASKLDYMKDLGVTAVWLNPVLENDMETYSYHGYSTTDYYKIDPRYGTNESYRALSRTAAAKGIKMVNDVIPNHCGSNHWFVRDPPTKDWVNYGGEYVNTNHRRTTVQDPHASAFDTRAHVDGWFVSTMPDLNQRNPLMATYLTQNAIWWIEYARLGGIRVDTYPYSDKTFLTNWTGAIMAEYPNFSIVGEEWSNQPAITSYWQAGKLNQDGYVSHLPQLMDFPVQEALRKALGKDEGWGSGFVGLYETVALDFLYADYNDLVVFPDNHDMDRIFTQVGQDVDLWKIAMAFNLTTRGIPQIYYGTEILMHNSDKPGDHGVIRTDFPGGWASDEVNGFTGAGLTAEQKDAKAWLKKLLNWRQTADVVHHGKLMQFAPLDNGLYVYFRYDGDEKLMVVLNKNEEPAELHIEQYAEMLRGATRVTDVLGGGSLALTKEMKVTGKGAFIWRVE